MVTVNINSPYVRVSGSHDLLPVNREEGWFTMGRQIAARLYRWRRYRASSPIRTNKCEIRCIHNAKGWVRKLTPDVRLALLFPFSPQPRVVTFSRSTSPARLHPPSARCKSIRHAAERYVYCRCVEKQNAPSLIPPEILRISRARARARVGGQRR